MMPARVTNLPENPLELSWHDSAWVPLLNGSNVMDYFSERSNPFYDRTCNNEAIKMQRLSPEHMNNMTGTEYVVLHVQEPILYVIRKQHRTSPTQTIPMADYYIIAGVVYQAPDLASVINSRLSTTVYNLQSAFDDLNGIMRYEPSKGYSWDIKAQPPTVRNNNKDIKEDPSSIFQRQRADMLLAELTRRFPIPVPRLPVPEQTENIPESTQSPKSETNFVPIKTEKIEESVAEDKSDPSSSSPVMKPPPEKKPRLT